MFTSKAFNRDPNPILVAFRKWCMKVPTQPISRVARVEVIDLDHGRAVGQAAATPAHIDHARKVLTRLARLEGLTP